MKSKLSTITTIVFGLMIFSLTKYYIKEYKKQVIKKPTVEPVTIIDKKSKPILIPSAQSVNSSVEQNYLGTGGRINSKR